MAIVNREWVGSAGNGDRRLRVSDVRDATRYFDIDIDAAITRLGGYDAAAEYGIKAAVSDAGSGGKTAADKISAARKWLEGSPDPRAVIAEYEAMMAAQREKMGEMERKL